MSVISDLFVSVCFVSSVFLLTSSHIISVISGLSSFIAALIHNQVTHNHTDVLGCALIHLAQSHICPGISLALSATFAANSL
jgi:hypothetical protein